MKVEVERMSNGYVLQIKDDEQRSIVIEEEDTTDDRGELEAMRTLLIEVKEALGVFNNKHKKLNLQIAITERQDD